MGADLRLILFDVDGTLVDSQASILAVIAVAFRTIRHAAPDRETVLGIVGLFLDRAVDHLVPDLDRDAKAAWVAAYKTAYFEARTKANSAEYTPLYLGARAMLDAHFVDRRIGRSGKGHGQRIHHLLLRGPFRGHGHGHLMAGQYQHGFCRGFHTVPVQCNTEPARVFDHRAVRPEPLLFPFAHLPVPHRVSKTASKSSNASIT